MTKGNIVLLKRLTTWMGRTKSPDPFPWFCSLVLNSAVSCNMTYVVCILLLRHRKGIIVFIFYYCFYFFFLPLCIKYCCVEGNKSSLSYGKPTVKVLRKYLKSLEDILPILKLTFMLRFKELLM